MSPSSADAWIAVAQERAADASALLLEREQSAGSVYLAGYAIECSLKAFLQRSGKAFPTAGGAGHDLRSLWSHSGFRLRDIDDESGSKSFFIQTWSTDLRYTVDPNFPCATTDLVAAAKRLSGWLQAQTRRWRTRK